MSDKILEKFSSDLKLCLFSYPEAESSFPEDEDGNYTITFGSSTYKSQRYVIKLSKYLTQAIKDKSNSKIIDVKLKYSDNEKAFEQVMKLLFGFKEVIIPHDQYIDVLAMIDQLGKHLSMI